VYSNILVPLDGSDLAECVLPHVNSLVEKYSSKKVTLAFVVEPSVYLDHKLMVEEEVHPVDPKIYEKLEAGVKKAASEYLTKTAGMVKAPRGQVKTEVLTGNPAERLAMYAKDNGVDAIIMASHGRTGFSRWVLGSVADRLLHISPIPVLVVPACVYKA
jgi:nucleotide-binding universal stress UspA family protein